MRQHVPQPNEPLHIGWIVSGMRESGMNRMKPPITTRRRRQLGDLEQMWTTTKKAQETFMTMSLGPWLIFVLFSFPFFVTNKFFRYLVLLTAMMTGGCHHHHRMRGKRDDDKRGKGRYTHDITCPTPTSICS